MKLVEANGTRIACFDEGEGGPPFVFIHGLACDHTFWQPQFDDLRRDHRCLSVDLRGRGESPVAFPCGPETAADDVAAVMRSLGVGPAIVVGHSLGGLVALLLNERHDELVLGTVLGDSPVRPPLSRDSRAATPEPQEHSQFMAELVERFWSETTPQAVKEKARSVMLSCPENVAKGMREGSGPILGRMADLVKLADKKPFMAIWAAAALGDPAWLRDVTMFLRQEPIAGTGHFFQLEEPAITNALLRAFEDDVRRDPRILPV